MCFVFLSEAIAASPTATVQPFKLLTVEPAFLPQQKVTVGLLETGFNTHDAFINTNTLMDLGMTGNIGFKYATPLTDELHLTLGGRYLKFFGESTAEKFMKEQNSNIESFKFNFSGYNAFLGATYVFSHSTLSLNAQYADISESKIFNLISAYSWNFAEYLHLVLEAGYDLENKQPRASLGLVRQSDSFGYRLGATYVEIDDPLFQTNVLPVLDLFWMFGGR